MQEDVLALAFVLPVFLVACTRDELALELIDRATGLVDESAEVTGHLRELARAKDHQDQQPDDDQLLSADTEHDANITWRLTGYNANSQPATDPTDTRTYILFRVGRSVANPISKRSARVGV